jgi:hypothetical protein
MVNCNKIILNGTNSYAHKKQQTANLARFLKLWDDAQNSGNSDGQRTAESQIDANGGSGSERC